MAYKTRKGLTTSGVGSPRFMYWIKDTIDNWLVAQGLTNRITVAYSGAGAGGDWLSETGPADDSYLVLESYTAWPSLEKWQILIAARTTAGASTVDTVVGGVAIPGPGLYFGIARDGGWNDTDKNFGAALFSGLMHINGLPNTGADMNAAQFAINVSDRMVGATADGCVFQMWSKDAAAWNGAVSIGHSYWFNPAETKPHQCMVGHCRNAAAAAAWGVVTGANGTIVNTIGLGHDAVSTDGFEYNGDGFVLGTGDWAGHPVILRDRTAGRQVGWLCGCQGGDNTTPDNTEDSTHSWVSIAGMLFPTQV